MGQLGGRILPSGEVIHRPAPIVLCNDTARDPPPVQANSNHEEGYGD